MLVLAFLIALTGARACTLQGVQLPDGVFTLTDHNSQVYNFSFCAALSESSGPCVGAGVCQRTNNASPSERFVSCGTFESAQVESSPLTISFSNGTACPTGPRTTVVEIACDASVFGLEIDGIEEMPACAYTIKARSNSACATQKPCTYTYDGKEINLNGLETISGSAYNFDYSLNLCKKEKVCDGYICQKILNQNRTVSLGSTLEPITNFGPYQAQLSYIDGTTCSSLGYPRISTVNLICGQNYKFINVTEASICHYDFYISHPAVCNGATGPVALLKREYLRK